jgi:hypothetical protein
MRFPSFVIFLLLFIFVSNQTYAAEPAIGQNISQDIASLKRMMEAMDSNMEVLKATVKAQNEIIERQNSRISAFENKQVPAMVSATAQTSPVRMKGLSQGLNPEIGVAATIQGNLTENTADEEGNDTVALKELEVSFAQYVDPYSRLDVTLALNDNLEEQNIDIEEAYYSHWALPLDFKGQIGKFRAAIGQQNRMHLHELDTVDYPLVIRNFFGEEGWSASGARLERMLWNPWNIPVQIIGEVMRGNEENSFSGVSRRPIFNTHLNTFFKTSENSELDLGGTVIFGDANPYRTVWVDDGTGTGTLIEEEFRPAEGQDRYGVQVYGADATWKWFLPGGEVLKSQSELYVQSRGANTSANTNPWGFYSLLDYRFSPRFSTGIRFDYLQPLDIANDNRYSYEVNPYLTFWQSEFASFRLQYRHSKAADPNQKDDNAVFLQANILIGSHKHPVR